MSKEMDVVIRDGDHDGEMGQYIMTVVPQPGQDVEDAVKASEVEVWAHNHGPKKHGSLVKAWFVMLSNGWWRIPFRTRFCLCRSREVARPPKCLVPGVLRASGLTMARRVDIHY